MVATEENQLGVKFDLSIVIAAWPDMRGLSSCLDSILAQRDGKHAYLVWEATQENRFIPKLAVLDQVVLKLRLLSTAGRQRTEGGAPPNDRREWPLRLFHFLWPIVLAVRMKRNDDVFPVRLRQDQPWVPSQAATITPSSERLEPFPYP